MKLLILFATFFKIGLIGFGGGYSILSLLMSEIQALGVSIEQFGDLLALDMIIPGPISTNAATYLGYLNSGVIGSIVATLGLSMPSYVLIMSLRRFLNRYRNAPLLSSALLGAKSASIGLIISAAITIATAEILKEGTFSLLNTGVESVSWIAALFFVAAFFVARSDKISPILLTLLGGALGAVFLRG